MKLGIVGNNDGPLYLLNALKKSVYYPQFIGLQKPVQSALSEKYELAIQERETQFFTGFDEAKLIKHLANFDIDLLINCFCNFRFKKILDQNFTVLNIHLSPLPAYRGRHPLQWALINGEKEFGFSIHKMTDVFDAGEIYWQEMVDIRDGMSTKQLRTELMQKLEGGFVDFLDRYEHGELDTMPNSNEEATYISRRYPCDSRLTEWHDSEIIYRKVQALWSEDHPAFFEINNHKIEVRGASRGKSFGKKPQKPFIADIKDNSLKVACLDKKNIWLKFSPADRKHIIIDQELA